MTVEFLFYNINEEEDDSFAYLRIFIEVGS